jgi:hypothetical protein
MHHRQMMNYEERSLRRRSPDPKKTFLNQITFGKSRSSAPLNQRHAMWDWHKSKMGSSLTVAFFEPSTVMTESPPELVIRKVHHEALYSLARAKVTDRSVILSVI